MGRASAACSHPAGCVRSRRAGSEGQLRRTVAAALVVGGKRDLSFATEATAAEDTTTLIQDELEAFVAQLTGELPPISHRWAGVWGETRDRLPLVGRLPMRENVWIAGGYSGHGNVLGLACGDLLARAILGESPPELELFDPARLVERRGVSA